MKATSTVVPNLLLATLLSSACIVDIDPANDFGGTESSEVDDGTGTDEDPALDTTVQAKLEFWRVFSASDYPNVDRVIHRLKHAKAASPEDHELELLHAHANLWKMVEGQRATSPDPAGIATAAEAAITSLEHYRQLEPSDARVFAWLAPALFGVAAMTQNDELMGTALQLADEGVATEPVFNSFIRLLMDAQAPANSAMFARAVDASYALIEHRIGRTIVPDDAESLDFSSLMAAGACDAADPPAYPSPARGQFSSSDPSCWNTWMAPHEYEGLWLYIGDTLLKGQHQTAARRAYENAQLGDSYEQWPHRALLEQRLRQFDQLSERFADDNPGNDPTMVVASAYSCSVCHQAAGGLDGRGALALQF